MEKHKCRICSRIFVNGRALGGHMRSHVWNPYMQSRTAGGGGGGGGDAVVVQDRESETESSLVSSVSDNSPEEDGAFCLMMLSRDKWTKEENSQSSGEVKKAAAVAVGSSKRKYRCESCRKVFRSYQALGGHRASHKKMIKAKAESFSGPREVWRNGDNEENVGESNVEEKLHECPFCCRVFSSGQALGGHKRSHFSAASACLLSPASK